MSSNSAVKRGSQKPRILLEPPHAYTDGRDAGKLSSAYGLTPDTWQQKVLDVWLGRDKSDKLTASSCGLSVPRQNGKNGLLEMRELYGMTVIGEAFLHTAHEVKTARKAFIRLCAFFENDRQYPELAEMVVSIRKTNGQEAIFLDNGGSIEFSARSRGSARGFTVDVVIFDEAQELTDEQLDAILPTLSASPLDNRQFIYTGTPPGPNSPGEVFSRVRKLALEGKETKIAWHEWSVEDIGDVTDKKRWYAANPAMGIRINEEFTEVELSSMSDDGFARERLGWWSSTTLNRILSETEWKNLATENPPSDGKMAFGVKFAPDGSVVTLAVAIKPSKGKVHIEVIDRRSMAHGTTWLCEWLLQRKESAAIVVIDGKSGAGALIERLNLEGFPKRAITTPYSREVATAASMLLEEIREQRVTHFDQPALNDSALNAQRRNIGDGSWGWGGSGDVDSTPIEAASLALWGVMTTKRDPKRKMRIG